MLRQVLCALFTILLVPVATFSRPVAQPSTLVVTTTADSGAGSLRQAILDANASRGLDTITFAIPGDAPHTISPATPLPDVVQPLVIDGSTQPGYEDRPIVELTGANIEGEANGISIRADGCTVRALVINRFGRAGVSVEQPTTAARLFGGNAVEGCYIGTDATGTQKAGNGYGVYVEIVPDTRIEGNVISGNVSHGIFVGQTDGRQIAGTSVRGNLVGVDATGTRALGNGGAGIRLYLGTSPLRIGGVEAGAGNVIAYNTTGGIDSDFSGGIAILSNAIFGNGRSHTGGSSAIDMNSPIMEPPILTSVARASGAVAVTGGVRSIWNPAGPTRIEFFLSGECGEGDYGQGERLVHAIDVERDESGFAAFTVTLPVELRPGEVLTATATAGDGSSSPFSRCYGISTGCVLPLLTEVPQEYVSIRSGESATLTAAASGSGPLAFQWYIVTLNGRTPIPGARSASYVTPPLASTTHYGVEVANACGRFGGAGTTVAVCSSAPEIQLRPETETASAGRIVTIYADTASGLAASYQWYIGTTGDTSHPLERNSGTGIRVGPITESVDYWVRVTDACGTTDSETGHIEFIPGPEIKKVTIKNVRGVPTIVAKGSGFASTVFVTLGGYGFVDPAVARGRKVTQSGLFYDGRTIDELIPRGQTVTLTFVNSGGGNTSVSYTRP